MDQKRFAYKNKDIKQDFYNALSSRKDLLNRPHYGPIQPNLKTELNKVSNRVKNFVKKVGNPSRVKIEQGNYFLYDDSNMIDQTFYTELNKKIQISMFKVIIHHINLANIFCLNKCNSNTL